ncbi:hypothetical protein TNCV_4019591 [Trichonephila clavipes]|nr:hypothetical protein TNCV_4019591 [Trichonephila clavipes]
MSLSDITGAVYTLSSSTAMNSSDNTIGQSNPAWVFPILFIPTRLYIEVIKLIKDIIRVQIMWFVRDEFLWGPFVAKFSSHSLVFSLASGMTETGVFSFQLLPASGRKMVPRGVYGSRGDPRQDRTIILMSQVPMHVW